MTISPTPDAAVSAALCHNWKKAVEINSTLLESDPTDIACLNRLGRAYLELGETKKAALFFKKVLKISKFDPIATKNLARAAQLQSKRSNGQTSIPQTLAKISFLEEPGQTKLAGLVNIAPSKILFTLNYADPVTITIRRHTVMITDQASHYLGALPDDLGHRLIVLIKGGNTYEGFIKSVSKNHVTVFFREVNRSKKFKNTPSFPTSVSDYLSFIREETPTEKVAPVETEDAATETDTPQTNRFADELQEDET